MRTTSTTRPGPGSAELHTRARASIPGGVNSNIRLASPRVVFERGAGAWLWDVDGNDYLDYLLGQGPNVLGHANAEVHTLVTEATGRGMVYGAQHQLEIEAAELFLRLVGWADQVRFGVSGTESVQAALRLARAATGRRRFIRFEGHYHGWLDNILASFDGGGAAPASAGQVGEYLADSVTLPWNDLDAVRDTLATRGDEIAAVITEPMMLNTGAVAPADGFLAGLRELCDTHGVVLIFDEVITGFRVALGGAAERFGVRPDLAVYGKALAGGWPVSALAGRRDLMERFGTGEVNHSGTFNASVMAAAAVLASLRQLERDRPHAAMEAHGRQLMTILGEQSARLGLDLRVRGLGMAFHASFGGPETITGFRDLRHTDGQRYVRLTRTLMEHGIWVAGRGIWYVSAAHGDRELEAARHRVEAALTVFAREEG